MTAQQAFKNTVVVILTLIAAYALYLSIRIWVVLLVAIIIASALRPVVLWLQKKGVPYGAGIGIAYFLLALTLFVTGVLVLPPAVNRLGEVVQNDDGLANRLILAQSWFERNVEDLLDTDINMLEPQVIRDSVADVVESIRHEFPDLAGEAGAIFGEFILAIVMGVYWLTARDQSIEYLSSMFSLGRRAQIRQMVDEIEYSLGNYVRGMALVVAFVTVANAIIMALFGVPNAILLAFIIGITTALPIVGGFIGAGVAVLLALVTGQPYHAVITFLSFAAVQQVETHYLTPKTMSNSVGLNPILIIVFLFIGFAVGGVMGGILAVPVAGAISILFRHLIIEQRIAENVPMHVEGGILIAKDNASLRESLATSPQAPTSPPTILKP